ncbi:hypothetical protein [Exiguobacterium sp. MH3]|uniref:hypothetical protein n=1 Tax=Exiguobacterium sp. MH3 TaxID=1399115 RepID=UPI0003C3B705|nr:hypothetical protein [Exiguobacterium sp. MH3]AHA31324.1 hypothetical protein U719_06800 [Exiguobacterium sp. MH3]
MSIDEDLKQIRKMLDDYNKYSEPLREAMVKTTEQLKKVFSDQKLREYQSLSESFVQKYSDVESFFASINWTEIFEGMSQIEKDILEFSDKLNEERIYLNFYYFESISFDKIHILLDREVAIKWMNDHIKDTIKYLSEKEFLARHKKLINQSYTAYENGDYELAILGMIPALEFFVGNWMINDKHNGEFDLKNPSRSQMNKKDLEALLKDHPDSGNKSLTIKHYFEMKAMDGVIKFYDGSKKNRVSRNSIVHGSHDYSRLESFDYVKLVYLFNSLLSLYGVTFKKNEQ